MDQFRFSGAAALCFIALSSTAWAQSSTSEIVVTATPLKAGSEGRTFTGAALADTRVADVTEFLKRAAGGVFVNDIQNNPLQPDVNYRGFTASPLLGTPQGLSVYVDGVRFNQPFGDVVSWDLIPKSAIGSLEIASGVNPLFGRNSLGGALSIRTRDGKSDPGAEIEASYGSFARRTLSGRTGGATDNGVHWFFSGDYFKEDGWRDFSPSEAGQAFGKVGWSGPKTGFAVSGAYADSDLNGNGLQEQRLLSADRSSVYTKPDNTQNRAGMLNFTAEHRFSEAITFNGDVFARKMRTRTFNGDINEESLGETLYQPSVAERNALAAAGYTGVPTAGETQANTPFPRFRCIANALLNSEPNEKCNGLINRSRTDQEEWGATGEARIRALAGNQVTLGGTYVSSTARFGQSSQFAYLTPDRGVVGVAGPGAFADGTQDSENAFDSRVDLSGRTISFSVYGADSVDLTSALRLDVSARYDRTDVRTNDRITPGGGAGSLDGDHRFERVNPALALRWEATPTLAFSLGAAETSRAPSAIELGCADPNNPCRLPNAMAGDPPLKQVVARTFEAGAKGQLAAFTWSLDAFTAMSRQDILFVSDDQAGFGYFRNFGRTLRRGFEAGVSGRTGPVLLSANYTFLNATYRSEEEVNGEANSSNDGPAAGFEGVIEIEKGDRIPLIPRHVFKAGAEWTVTEAARVNLDMIFVSGVFARGNENNEHAADGVYYLGPGKTDDYAVFNLGGDWKIGDALTLFVQVNNLFDKDYATAVQLGATGFDASGNFVARPFIAPVIGGERPLVSSTFYAPGAPRAGLVGARLKF
jgi:outer membrane receptor protein involved in Fe transport